MSSRMLSGSPILTGDSTIPGLKIHKEVAEQLPAIEKACQEMGLDYYPIIVEFVRYDEMAELASYGGFPIRYPHWRFGMEYEEMSRGYEFGQYRISEMVINTNPCYIFCMDSNSLVDNVDVIAHAIGHNDFFKNNIFFEQTDRNMMNKMANHGARIRKYMERWGKETVTEFIDHCLRIDTLIDPNKAWERKESTQISYKDHREYHHPQRLKPTNNYMDEWVNNKEFIEKQKAAILEREKRQSMGLFEGSVKDIMGFIKDEAPLKAWQQDIISMLYEESMYFAPQRITKMINEGWASYTDYVIMCRMGLASLGQDNIGAGIWEYSRHKMRVLGGKYSMNPYKLGFELFMDIEDRWNKGKFGFEYDYCKDMRKKEEWNQNLRLGKDKVFEVRRNYNDFLMIQEFFTEEFCREKEFFEWEQKENGEMVVASKDFNKIKKGLLKRYINNGLPDIRLVDSNHSGSGAMLLEHQWEGDILEINYAKEVMISLFRLWGKPVHLSTRNSLGKEIVLTCHNEDINKFMIETREEFNNSF